MGRKKNRFPYFPTVKEMHRKIKSKKVEDFLLRRIRGMFRYGHYIQWVRCEKNR